MSGNKVISVLFINHWAANCGGAEYSLIDIIECTAKVAKTYLITSEHGELVRRIALTPCTTIVIPCTPNVLEIKREHLFRTMIMNWKGIISFLRFVHQVKKKVGILCPDCIHANVPKSHMVLFLLKLSGYRGRFIIHMRELFTNGGSAQHLYQFMYRIAGHVDIIAISNAVKGSLPASMRPYATVIYNGITIGVEREKFTTELPIRFLLLGRIVPWKGCDLLVKAFEVVMEKSGIAAARLTLMGDTCYWDNAYRNKLTELIEKSRAASSINLYESTVNPAVVLQQHDILCLPSQDEPFGRVAAEAQGHGMPVIGFDGGGVPEIVVHGVTGLLVHERNHNAFAEAMLRFINDPSLIACMGLEGRKRVSALFDKRKQIPKIVQMIVGESADE